MERTGFAIVLYLGAMQSLIIAYTSGKCRWGEWVASVQIDHYSSIKPVLTIQIILSVKGALSVFEIPFI